MLPPPHRHDGLYGVTFAGRCSNRHARRLRGVVRSRRVAGAARLGFSAGRPDEWTGRRDGQRASRSKVPIRCGNTGCAPESLEQGPSARPCRRGARRRAVADCQNPPGRAFHDLRRRVSGGAAGQISLPVAALPSAPAAGETCATIVIALPSAPTCYRRGARPSTPNRAEAAEELAAMCWAQPRCDVAE